MVCFVHFAIEGYVLLIGETHIGSSKCTMIACFTHNKGN